MESGIVVAPNHNLRAETAESLADWRTRSNCRKDGAHQILKETTAVPTELFAEKAAFDLQEMPEDGSPPENAPQQLPQSTNDLEACMPPTSRSQADHYSASPSARDNTQSVRVHRMPSGRNQRVQSSIR